MYENCPQCGFSYKWDGKSCGHCDWPRTKRARKTEAKRRNPRGDYVGRLFASFTRVSAFALLTIIAIYYALIFAHWQDIVGVSAVQSGFALLTHVLAFALVTIPMLTVKSGWLLGNRTRWRAVLIFSSIVFMIWGMTLLNPQGWIGRFMSSPYMKEYNSVWLGLPVILFFAAITRIVFLSGDVASFVTEFKAFPMVSPVFCFGAPAFWDKSLKALGMPTGDVQFAGGVSVLSGVAFVVALVLFFVAKHVRDTSQATGQSIIIPDSSTEQKPNGRRLWMASLASIMIGLCGISFVCMKVAYAVIVSMSGDAS